MLYWGFATWREGGYYATSMRVNCDEKKDRQKETNRKRDNRRKTSKLRCYVDEKKDRQKETDRKKERQKKDKEAAMLRR